MCYHMGLPGATQQESEDHVELEMILGQPAGAGDSCVYHLSQPSAWACGMLTVFIYGYSFLTHSFPSSALIGTDARTTGPLLSHLSLALILIPDPTHHL